MDYAVRTLWKELKRVNEYVNDLNEHDGKLLYESLLKKQEDLVIAISLLNEEISKRNDSGAG